MSEKSTLVSKYQGAFIIPKWVGVFRFGRVYSLTMFDVFE